jgi:hypothetical protein
VFNIGDILMMGAGSKIVMVNGANSDSVIWNAGGYAKLDLDSSFLGTLLARDYINVGAKARPWVPVVPVVACSQRYHTLALVTPRKSVLMAVAASLRVSMSIVTAKWLITPLHSL